MNGADFREYFNDAIRFWEPRRVLYNLALAIIVVAYFFAGYPSSKAVLSIDFALGLFMLAVVANIAITPHTWLTSSFRHQDFAISGNGDDGAFRNRHTFRRDHHPLHRNGNVPPRHLGEQAVSTGK